MKKIMFIVLLAVVCLSSAAADTVLFCLSDNQNSGEPSGWTVSVLRAIEDGVLDVFFNEGHIITNSYLNECRDLIGDDSAAESEVARVLGNRMGADRVLMLKVFFPPAFPDTLPVPDRAEYSVYSNSGKVVSEQAESVFNIAIEKGEEELLDSFTEIGRDIASKLAEGM